MEKFQNGTNIQVGYFALISCLFNYYSRLQSVRGSMNLGAED
jgi:hypothetical protein